MVYCSSYHNNYIDYTKLFFPSKKRDPTDSFGEENEEPSLGKNKCYYMASFVSGQDEPKRAL